MNHRQGFASYVRAGFAMALGLAAVALQSCALLGEPEPTIITGGEAWTHMPDVPFVVSDEEVVRAMLELAGVSARDVVYDLGCGDGRIVITAAARYGARGVGVDMDPFPLRMARAGAQRAGVTDRVRFIRGDLYETDLRGATVVTLYLSPEVNQRLLPKLLAELPAGARIVSHKFSMGEAWAPHKTVRAGDSTLYLWIVPARQPPKAGRR